ncbi:hypothetical protein Patl1_33137 [Pistacia atlantica]|uniref:Uncharacterized protein n=1 Tax=Pistacia atlantica TaxID=434234 RepID=A0ACC1ANI9_9ROSI|nr:hypothetical protein Patl1_33137 [Pistacia atlantica]
MKFVGVMVVLVHLDILSIIKNCFLDWWKVLGTGKDGTLQPGMKKRTLKLRNILIISNQLAPPNPMKITLFEGKQKHVIINFVLHRFSTSVLLLQSFQYLLLHFTPASNSLLLIFYYCWAVKGKGLAEKWWAVVVAMAEEEQRRPWMDEFVLLAV